jgi:hypothetical protein
MARWVVLHFFRLGLEYAKFGRHSVTEFRGQIMEGHTTEPADESLNSSYNFIFQNDISIAISVALSPIIQKSEGYIHEVLP